MIETLRGLLPGTPIGNNGAVSVAWSIAIAGVGYLCAMKPYDPDPGPR